MYTEDSQNLKNNVFRDVRHSTSHSALDYIFLHAAIATAGNWQFFSHLPHVIGGISTTFRTPQRPLTSCPPLQGTGNREPSSAPALPYASPRRRSASQSPVVYSTGELAQTTSVTCDAVFPNRGATHTVYLSIPVTLHSAHPRVCAVI